MSEASYWLQEGEKPQGKNARQVTRFCYKCDIYPLRCPLGDNVFQLLRRVVSFIALETKTWGGTLAFIASFFILATAITNALYGIFDLNLLPIFENTLVHVRLFFHELFELVLYRPIGWVGSLIASWLIPNVVLPDLRPPNWYADFVLISMVLSRAERSAMKMSSPVAHTPDDNSEFSRLERASWIIVLAFYIPTKALLLPFKKWTPKHIYDAARVFLDGLTWLGIWFLVHDIMVVRMNWSSQRDRDTSHRAFVAYLLLSLFAAIVAVAIFFVMNGYLHDRFLNSTASD